MQCFRLSKNLSVERNIPNACGVIMQILSKMMAYDYPPPPPPPSSRKINRFILAGILVAIIAVASISGAYYLNHPKPSPTPAPTISGQAVLPNLDVSYTNNLPGGGLYAVYLCDLSYNTLANVTHPGQPDDNSYSFTVAANQS